MAVCSQNRSSGGTVADGLVAAVKSWLERSAISQLDTHARTQEGSATSTVMLSTLKLLHWAGLSLGLVMIALPTPRSSIGS